MADSIKALLAAVLSVFCGFLAYFLSFGVSGALWWNLAAAMAGFALSMWFLMRHSRRRAAIVAGGTVCLLAAAIAPTLAGRFRTVPPPAPRDLVDRIGRTSIALEGVDAGAGFRDMEPLRNVWRGVRMVALGEATHGTSEFFRMKHRVTEFLVTEMGFRHFAMELSPRAGKRIDDYIQGDTAANPAASLGWPWGTREVAKMFEWMRWYNASVPDADRLHFHGIDYQGERRDFHMAQNVLDLLQQVPPESRVVLWAHNGHVSSGSGWMGFYLKQALRAQIYLAGFEFHHGQFTSRLEWVRTYEAEPADDGYYAGTLARTGHPILFLDFRSMRQDPAVDAWLAEPRLAHDLQEAHGFFRLSRSWVTTEESWPSLFDGIVYIERSTPAGLVR